MGQGPNMQALTFFFAFVAVLALIGAAAWLVRRFAGSRLGANTNRGRMPRLAVIDAAAVDGRRRLVLVRRDNIEHLLMIGGPTDIVVEPNIVRATTRDQMSPRPAVAGTERADEVGQMARTVAVFRDAMTETNRLREAQAAVEARQVQQRKADMNSLADQFEREVGEIITLVSTAASQLEGSAGTLSKTAETVQGVSQRAAGASSDASSSVHSVAAASEPRNRRRFISACSVVRWTTRADCRLFAARWPPGEPAYGSPTSPNFAATAANRTIARLNMSATLREGQL